MIVCPQCKGYGKTRDINLALNVPNGSTFTLPTQNQAAPCNYCRGTGTFAGAGS